MKNKKKFIILGIAPLILAGCGEPKEEPHTHAYDHEHPVWTWSEDNSSATLLLDCPGCDEDLTVTANSSVKTEASPTCTEGSVKVLEVSAELDGETFTDEKEIAVDPIGHQMVKHNAVAPSCTEPGTKEYWTCSHEEGVLFKDENGAEKFNSEEELVVAATGHKYGTPTYSWSGDQCTAKKECEHGDDTVTETVTGRFVQDTPATCEAPQKGHYVATFTKEGFVEQSTAANSVTGESAKGHDWGTPSYSWSGDKCTAKRICKNDSTHVDTETVTGVYVKDTNATCDANEKGHYKATFNNSAFAEQNTAANSVEKPNTKLGHDWGNPTYEWSDDKCTAKRVCKHDSNHVETETVTGTYVKDSDATCTTKEKGHYKATFNNSAFAEQNTAANSVEKPNSELGHDWGNPTYEWSDDKCTAKRVCKHDSNHVETETVTGTYVKDSDATCTVNEKGHYEATFQNAAFAKQSTAANSVNIADSALGHDMTHHDGSAPTCGVAGSHEYWTCSHEAGVYFKDKQGSETFANESELVIPATGDHSYGTPEYTWSDDNKTVTASVKCDECDHVATETVNVTSEVTLEPTTTAKGQTTYTATFANALFSTQTKTLTDIENKVGIIADSCVTLAGEAAIDESDIDTVDGFTKATLVKNTHSSANKYLNLNLLSLDMYDFVEFAAKSDGTHWFEVPDVNKGGAGAIQKAEYKVYRLEREIVEGQVLYGLFYKDSGAAKFTRSGKSGGLNTYVNPAELDKFEFKMGASYAQAYVSEIRGKLRLDNESVVATSPLASGVNTQSCKYNVNYPLTDIAAIGNKQMVFSFTNNSNIKAYYGIGKAEWDINAGTTSICYINKLENGMFDFKFMNGNREVNSSGYRTEVKTKTIELDEASLNTLNFRCHGEGAADVSISFSELYAVKDAAYDPATPIEKLISFTGDNQNYTLAINGHDETEFIANKGETISFAVTPAEGYEAKVLLNGQPLEGEGNDFEFVVSANSTLVVSVEKKVSLTWGVISNRTIADTNTNWKDAGTPTYVFDECDTKTAIRKGSGLTIADETPYQLQSVDLTGYTKIVFFLRDSGSTGCYFKLTNNHGEKAVSTADINLSAADWHKITLTLNDGSWDLVLDDNPTHNKNCSLGAMDNLSDLNLVLWGYRTYQISCTYGAKLG